MSAHLCSYNSLSSSGKTFQRFSSVYGKFWPFFQKYIHEVCPTVSAVIHPKAVWLCWGQKSQLLPHQTPSVIPPLPNFRLSTMQPDKYHSRHPPNPESFIRLLYGEAWIVYALESSVCFILLNLTVCCAWWCRAWTQLPGHENPLYEGLAALLLS